MTNFDLNMANLFDFCVTYFHLTFYYIDFHTILLIFCIIVLISEYEFEDDKFHDEGLNQFSFVVPIN